MFVLVAARSGSKAAVYIHEQVWGFKQDGGWCEAASFGLCSRFARSSGNESSSPGSGAKAGAGTSHERASHRKVQSLQAWNLGQSRQKKRYNLRCWFGT